MAHQLSASAAPPQVLKTIDVATIPTDIILTEYANRYFIVVTQIDKFGTFVNAWAESKADGEYSYHTRELMGVRDDVLYETIARHIMEHVCVASNYTKAGKEVLLAISLKGRSTNAANSNENFGDNADFELFKSITQGIKDMM